MKYKEKRDRAQISFLPACVEDYIDAENPVRVIDAFVDSLDMEALGFRKAKPAQTGRPAYDPRDLLKLYLYGYLNRIRSSRMLMRECGRNIELFYLLGGLKPDFRTIADFRKDNAKAIRGTFRAFGKLCVKLGLYKRELLAVDGTKIRAVNSYEGTGITVEVQTKGTISCFLRDENEHVTCPMGHELRYSRKRGRCTIYKDKELCRECKYKCTNGEHKEFSFGPETDCVPVRMFGTLTKPVQKIPRDARISPSNHTLDTGHVPKKKVVLRIQDDKEKLKQRMCLSEHPFGTVKWYNGAHYLLCKGKTKAAAELGLSFLAYNLTRTIHLVGVKALIAAM